MKKLVYRLYCQAISLNIQTDIINRYYDNLSANLF